MAIFTLYVITSIAPRLYHTVWLIKACLWEKREKTLGRLLFLCYNIDIQYHAPVSNLHLMRSVVVK